MTSYRSPQIRQLGHVLAGADTGCYTLPAEVQDARAAVDRLLAETAVQGRG